jgi:uncharacterized protein
VSTPLIDADAHLTEPPDLWTSRMSSQRWGAYIPRVQYDEAVGLEAWFIGDDRIGLFGASSMVVDPEGGDYPVRWENAFPEFPRLAQIHPSSWDAKERLKIMDDHGIAVSALYGNLGVSRNYYADIEDEGFRLEIVRTYNDFLVEWMSPAPERFVALANVPFWDSNAAAAETARAAKLGHRGIVMTGIPERHGLPPLADRSWDVLWEACTEHGMPIHFHSGGGDTSGAINSVRQRSMGAGAMMAAGTTNIILDTGMSLSDLLHSGVLPRFPETRWVVVESAVGYMPFVLECADEHFRRYQSTGYEMYEALPSEYFHRQVFGTYWFEKLDQHVLDRVGAENVMFETDYPHPTCLLRDEIVHAANEGLAAVDPDDRQKILWRNAATLYGIEELPSTPTVAR